MLMPKKTKFRKMQKGRVRGMSKGCRTIVFGEYGLQVLESTRMSAQQIEAMRLVVSRNLKKVGKFFLRVFPDKPITKNPAETRMGKGKGSVESWVSVVKRGRIICEVSGVDETTARSMFKAVSYKLPMRTRFVKKENNILAKEVSSHESN